MVEQQVGQPVAPQLPGGIDTPALVIDIGIVERNAQGMAAAVRERGVALRPHVKTHKSVAIARIQLAAGAQGITVGTLGEAEVMAEADIDDIFVAYPIWAHDGKAARLKALHDRPGLVLSVGVDSVGGAQRLAAAVAGSARPLRVLVELDSGHHRTGVEPAQAGAVARAAREAGLEVIGLFTYAGHVYGGLGKAAPAAADEIAALAAGRAAVQRVGIEPGVLSAGSSPTALRAATAPVSEVRPGTYVIGDRQQVALAASPPDGVAVAVAATVVSESAGQVVINAGAKTLTKDVPAYLAGFGCLPAYPDGALEHLSDYHGVITFPPGSRRPVLGEVVAVVPNHACPVIDLFDTFLATRDGELLGEWRVDARGRSS
jgi:D-serine deaminase-like pyridoxal phosphate-dependent protein